MFAGKTCLTLGEATTLLTYSLNQLGFGLVFWAATEDDVINQLEQFSFDLVVLDAPEATALATLTALRTHHREELRCLPMIVILAAPRRKMIEVIRDAGGSGAIFRPFSLASLQAQIQRATCSARMFIDTPTYAGPDRRRGACHKYSGPERRAETEDRFYVE